MGRYRNPILPGCRPDPSICRVGDAYYLVTSTFAYLPGIPIHRSRNLVDWELVGHVVHRPGQLDLQGLASSRGLYAPTIRAHDGGFAVVCTVVGPDEGAAPVRTGHVVFTAPDAEGPWSDPIWIDGVGGIDPSLAFDGDRVWLCGTRLAENGRWSGQTDVWLVELDARTFQPVGPESVIWQGAMTGALWAEGPHLQRRPGGVWMLVAAEGGTARDHAVCIAYADEITGPYRGDPGNPRLTHRDLGDRAPIADVGHADLVEGVDGRWWATVLAVHTIDGRNDLVGRRTHLVPVGWEDRRPLFAPGSGRVHEVVDAAGVPDQRDEAAAVRDDFDEASLSLDWTAPGRLPESFVDLGARPGWARVRASVVEPGEVGALAFLGRRMPWAHTRVSARIALGGAARGGLLLRCAEDAYLEVSTGAAITVARALRGPAEVVARVPGAVEVPGDVDAPGEVAADLEIDVRGLEATVRVDGVELACVDVAALAPDGSSMFVGAWAGVFAVGEGHLDVDRIDLERLD